ncbi:AraC family transcriptional regulator [Flagellimonas lutimaris]|uniref:AraC family transcriptional regulator n=1 Tax=Flagellimonas lutimaris TaxID=475082 RepID=A0A3A1ND33_9FLAO|nr:helix-turn-helix transcriptional regulator [Allomuricauda lutimaris]RIV35998.1 AraC family transcriptional regulator [Allomuricauda lutimaris]
MLQSRNEFKYQVMVVKNRLDRTEDRIVCNIDRNTYVETISSSGCASKSIGFNQALILMTMEGEQTVRTHINKTRLEQNEMVFLNQGTDIIGGEICIEGEFNAALIVLHESYLQEFKLKYRDYITASINQFDQRLTKVTTPANVVPYVDFLIAYFKENNKVANPIVRIKVEALLLMMLLSDNSLPFQKFLLTIGEPEKINFRAKVEQTMYENLTIPERAELANMSLSSFKRRFVEVYRETPGKWFRRQRLKKAEELIHMSGKNISEVAHELGFENMSHFIGAFKKQFGRTPSQFEFQSSAS